LFANHALEGKAGGFVRGGKVAVEGFADFLLEVGDYFV